MSSDSIAVRPPRKQAVFLGANFSVFATTTRQPMTRHGFDADCPAAPGTGAILLQIIEDAVHGAPREMPFDAGKSAGRMENRQPSRNLGGLSAV
jgi:hypothetical protein